MYTSNEVLPLSICDSGEEAEGLGTVLDTAVVLAEFRRGLKRSAREKIPVEEWVEEYPCSIRKRNYNTDVGDMANNISDVLLTDTECYNDHPLGSIHSYKGKAVNKHDSKWLYDFIRKRSGYGD